MVQALYVALCCVVALSISGIFPIVHAVYRKYHLILNGKTWTDARTYCRAMYTDLATFETPDEITQLQNIAKSQNCADSIWIGLYNDVNSWRWSMGNVPLGSLKDWYSPNPDNLLAKESCGAIDPNGWYDYSCTTLLTFICFDDSYNGTSSYVFISTNVTWSDALTYCRQNHTDLASVRSSAENSILKSLAVNGGSWFGLFRDTWKWSDQTNFSSVPWLAGEPNNLLKVENCVFFLTVGLVMCCAHA
ncbi:macrophage mannose receptor 1-like [Silurus meridionalis]|uniref:macrophage mannose receptor 1-like n=1 Tax=Silurus meridionalis TaxID=175797 RepID=UPI001EEBB048|nr:macrophage mannose receptor 1-like [Silurus meridionalis]